MPYHYRQVGFWGVELISHFLHRPDGWLGQPAPRRCPLKAHQMHISKATTVAAASNDLIDSGGLGWSKGIQNEHIGLRLRHNPDRHIHHRLRQILAPPLFKSALQGGVESSLALD